MFPNALLLSVSLLTGLFLFKSLDLDYVIFDPNMAKFTDNRSSYERQVSQQVSLFLHVDSRITAGCLVISFTKGNPAISGTISALEG
jgi:hypothetical protein